MQCERLRTAAPADFDNVAPRWMLLTAIRPPRPNSSKPATIPGEPYPHKHAWVVRWKKGRKVIDEDTVKDMEDTLGCRKGAVSEALRVGRLIHGGKLVKIPAPKVRP